MFDNGEKFKQYIYDIKEYEIKNKIVIYIKNRDSSCIHTLA